MPHLNIFVSNKIIVNCKRQRKYATKNVMIDLQEEKKTNQELSHDRYFVTEKLFHTRFKIYILMFEPSLSRFIR